MQFARGNHDLAAATPSSDYILWLRRQDRQSAEAFWRSQLQRFTAPALFQRRSTDRHALAPLPQAISSIMWNCHRHCLPH